jgi:hypothetical protein
MYEKGLLKTTTPRCEETDESGHCNQSEYDVGHRHRVSDSRSFEPGSGVYKELGPGTAYLPHSCNEWVIGGPDHIRALIEDLQSALAQLESE